MRKQLDMERSQLTAVYSLVSIQLVDMEVLHSRTHLEITRRQQHHHAAMQASREAAALAAGALAQVQQQLQQEQQLRLQLEHAEAENVGMYEALGAVDCERAALLRRLHAAQQEQARHEEDKQAVERIWATERAGAVYVAEQLREELQAAHAHEELLQQQVRSLELSLAESNEAQAESWASVCRSLSLSFSRARSLSHTHTRTHTRRKPSHGLCVQKENSAKLARNCSFHYKCS